MFSVKGTLLRLKMTSKENICCALMYLILSSNLIESIVSPRLHLTHFCLTRSHNLLSHFPTTKCCQSHASGTGSGLIPRLRTFGKTSIHGMLVPVGHRCSSLIEFDFLLLLNRPRMLDNNLSVRYLLKIPICQNGFNYYYVVHPCPICIA